MYWYPTELYHYEILGMKWGVHRSNKAAYKTKLTAISNNNSNGINASDERRIKYRNQTLAKRFGKTA